MCIDNEMGAKGPLPPRAPCMPATLCCLTTRTNTLLTDVRMEYKLRNNLESAELMRTTRTRPTCWEIFSILFKFSTFSPRKLENLNTHLRQNNVTIARRDFAHLATAACRKKAKIWWEKRKQQAKAETGGADQWVLKRRELPGFTIVNEKKRPHPWDTHYQFSIKTLLPNTKQRKRGITKWKMSTCGPGSRKWTEIKNSSLMYTRNRQIGNKGKLTHKNQENWLAAAASQRKKEKYLTKMREPWKGKKLEQNRRKCWQEIILDLPFGFQ